MSNTNNTMQTQTSNALHNAIMEVGGKDRSPMLARVVEGSLETTTEGYMENYKNVSEDIRNLLNVEAEVVHIILTWIDNDIYSIVDACPNAIEMWQTIERLKQGESINVQDLETNLYWEFGKFTSRDGESLESYYSRFYKMMNELVCDTVKSESRSWRLSPTTTYDILKQHHNEVNEIRALKDSTYCKSTYTTARETVRNTGVQQSGIQCISLRNLACSKDQELEAHYLYMEKIQEVTPDDADNSGPTNDEPFTKEEKADQDDDGLARERYLLASLIGKLKCEIDDRKNRNKLLESSNKTLVDKLKSEIEDFKNKN
ncbi:hypothetical protein Tco_0635514 [Tanacetum coccineum]